MTDMLEASREFMVAAQRLPTLFDLTAEAMELLAALDEPEVEGDGTAIESRLATLETQLATKFESYCSVIREAEVLRDRRKAEADRLAARAATLDRGVQFLKARLLQHMKLLGQSRVEMSRFTLAIRVNPPRVDVLEPMLVPGEFQRVIPARIEPDKRAILDHYKLTGEIPEGCDVVRGERIAIT